MDLVGLILWGISIDRGYHWIVGQIAFFLCKWKSFMVPRVRMLMRFSSRGGDPDGQHGDGQLRGGLLPIAVDERHHVLCSDYQPQCFHQPGKCGAGVRPR